MHRRRRDPRDIDRQPAELVGETVIDVAVVRFVGADEGRSLNRRFRGRNQATNVLTFDYEAEPLVTADIVVCMPVVRGEARSQRKTQRDHLAHLVVHGVLHAQGHDHDDAADAERMEAREIAILRRFGIDDPYA